MAKKLTAQHKLTKRPKVKTTKVVPKTRREILESDDFKEAVLFDKRKAHTERTLRPDWAGKRKDQKVDASDAGMYDQQKGMYGAARRERLELVPLLGSSKRPGGYPPEDWEKSGVPYIGSSRATKIVNRANPARKSKPDETAAAVGFMGGGMVMSRGNGIARTKKGTKYV